MAWRRACTAVCSSSNDTAPSRRLPGQTLCGIALTYPSEYQLSVFMYAWVFPRHSYLYHHNVLVLAYKFSRRAAVVLGRRRLAGSHACDANGPCSGVILSYTFLTVRFDVSRITPSRSVLKNVTSSNGCGAQATHGSRRPYAEYMARAAVTRYFTAGSGISAL